MKTTIRNYRGYIITSFNLAQLDDSETRGRSYSVYANEEAYDAAHRDDPVEDYDDDEEDES